MELTPVQIKYFCSLTWWCSYCIFSCS